MTPPTLLVIATIVFLVYYWVRRSGSAVKAVLGAYRRCEYEIALKKTEGLRKGSSKTAAYCFFRGKMLYHLGKLTEAEAELREGLLLEKDARRAALATEAIGLTLMEQGRYEDAIACFESCIRAWPDRGCGHRAVAEARLRRADGTVEALARARRAVEIDRSARALTGEIHNLNLSESLATLAWAVAAESGDAAEVERLLAEAFPRCGNKAKPILAQLHYHAGRAYSALDMPEKSVSHFGHAMRIDPRGNFGRLSRAMAALGAAG